MQVKNLIKKLQQYPEDTEVLVNSYEGGYDSILHIREVIVQKEQLPAEYMGDYESVDSTNNDNPTYKATILARKSFYE